MLQLFKNKKEKNILDIKNNKFIEIEIKEECTQEEYNLALNKIERLNITKELLLTKGYNINNSNLAKQKIVVMNFNGHRITIIIGDNEIRISEIFYTSDDFIDENRLKITNNQITVTKYLHDLSYNTQFCKCYPNDNPQTQNWTLDKNEALSICKSLIHFISHIININDTLNIEVINQIIDDMETKSQKTIGTWK